MTAVWDKIEMIVQEKSYDSGVWIDEVEPLIKMLIKVYIAGAPAQRRTELVRCIRI